jgi:hypothetical protein
MSSVGSNTEVNLYLRFVLWWWWWIPFSWKCLERIHSFGGGATTFSIMTLSITTFWIKSLSIMTLWIMAFRIYDTRHKSILSIVSAECSNCSHNGECHCAECRYAERCQADCCGSIRKGYEMQRYPVSWHSAYQHSA